MEEKKQDKEVYIGNIKRIRKEISRTRHACSEKPSSHCWSDRNVKNVKNISVGITSMPTEICCQITLTQFKLRAHFFPYCHLRPTISSFQISYEVPSFKHDITGTWLQGFHSTPSFSLFPSLPRWVFSTVLITCSLWLLRKRWQTAAFWNSSMFSCSLTRIPLPHRLLGPLPSAAAYLPLIAYREQRICVQFFHVHKSTFT